MAYTTGSRSMKSIERCKSKLVETIESIPTESDTRKGELIFALRKAQELKTLSEEMNVLISAAIAERAVEWDETRV